MKRISYKSILAVAATVALLTACENIGHIVPANEQAEQISGEMTAHFTSFSTGNGTIDAIGPGGELLKGSYGPIAADYTFGSVFNAVYGVYSTMPTAADKGTPTVATLTGTKGTTLQCEFYNDDYTGHGFGACKSMAGALYKLNY